MQVKKNNIPQVFYVRIYSFQHEKRKKNEKRDVFLFVCKHRLPIVSDVSVCLIVLFFPALFFLEFIHLS